MDAEAFKENERLAWNLCAQRYDRCLAPLFTPICQRLIALAQLKKGQRVLDVATGTGLAALLSSPLVGPHGWVTGVDLSDAMIQLARKRASEEQVTNVEFLQMDAERLELRSESFDAVLCTLGLMLFPAPARALSEMHRVLKKFGVLALCVFGRGSKVALRALIEPFIPHMPPSPQRGPSIFGFGHLDALQEALAKAGFSDVVTEQEAHTLSFGGAEGVWEMLLSLGRLGQMYSRLPRAAQEELKQAVFRIARDKYRDPRGRMDLPFEITYAVAHK